MATEPPSFFDVTRLMKEFDPNKVAAEFSNALKQYAFSGAVSPNSLVASQQENLEALTSANRVLFEGLQRVAERQAEILQETMNEASKAVDELSKMGSPPEIVAKQAELTKNAFEGALANMRELAAIVNNANQEASNTVNARISASLDEIKKLALKMASGRSQQDDI